MCILLTPMSFEVNAKVSHSLAFVLQSRQWVTQRTRENSKFVDMKTSGYASLLYLLGLIHHTHAHAHTHMPTQTQPREHKHTDTPTCTETHTCAVGPHTYTHTYSLTHTGNRVRQTSAGPGSVWSALCAGLKGERRVHKGVCMWAYVWINMKRTGRIQIFLRRVPKDFHKVAFIFSPGPVVSWSSSSMCSFRTLKEHMLKIVKDAYIQHLTNWQIPTWPNLWDSITNQNQCVISQWVPDRA